MGLGADGAGFTQVEEDETLWEELEIRSEHSDSDASLSASLLLS